MHFRSQYPAPATGPQAGASRYNDYSRLMSSAQRLLNGNTLISEVNTALIFKVMAEGETVWEFVNPLQEAGEAFRGIYRAYRVPYEGVPRVEPLRQVAVPRIDSSQFCVPGSQQLPARKARARKAAIDEEEQFCATPGEGI